MTVADIRAVSAAMPSPTCDRHTWAAWQDQLADLHTRIAAEGGPDACRHVLLAAVACAEATRARSTASTAGR